MELKSMCVFISASVCNAWYAYHDCWRFIGSAAIVYATIKENMEFQPFSSHFFFCSANTVFCYRTNLKSERIKWKKANLNVLSSLNQKLVLIKFRFPEILSYKSNYMQIFSIREKTKTKEIKWWIKKWIFTRLVNYVMCATVL